MSVINKMLQDLDARQNGAREAGGLYTKPAAQGERRVSAALVAGAAVGVAAIAFGTAFGWRYWQHRAQPAVSAPAPAKVVIMPAPPKVTPLPQQPAAAASPADATRTAPPVVSEAAAPMPATEPDEPAKPVAKPTSQHAKSQRPPVADKRSVSKKTSAGHDKRNPAPAGGAKAGAAAPAVKPSEAGKVETASQRAEAAYRRGMASIQEGYVSDGIGALEQALQANPHHDAARQTLVRVLIDNRRFDEAMRQLEVALTLDPKQPSMAMLLARLQIERGAGGIDTLMRTLPYVGANGEYHAFLAGALQRQQRHREAIEQYQAALRTLPQNGVWLMGLGISLQAEKRDGEALEVFRKAKASGSLNAALSTFVDSQIQQLAR